MTDRVEFMIGLATGSPKIEKEKQYLATCICAAVDNMSVKKGQVLNRGVARGGQKCLFMQQKPTL